MKILSIILGLLLCCCSLPEQDQIIITPGNQIQLEGINVKLKETTVIELLHKLKIEDIFGVAHSHWDGVDMETGESTYGDELVKNVIYKGIDFEFTGQSEDSLVLDWIKIEKSNHWDVVINQELRLGATNPPLDKYFTKQNRHDYISKDSLTYNLYSQGISFQLEQINSDRIIKEVSVHYKIEE